MVKMGWRLTARTESTNSVIGAVVHLPDSFEPAGISGLHVINRHPSPYTLLSITLTLAGQPRTPATRGAHALARPAAT